MRTAAKIIPIQNQDADNVSKVHATGSKNLRSRTGCGPPSTNHGAESALRLLASITFLSWDGIPGWRTHGAVCHVCEENRRHRKRRDICATLNLRNTVILLVR